LFELFHNESASVNPDDMSLRLELLQVARLAPKLLGESSDLVRTFLLGEQNSDGGFRDRDGRSDLYYTSFGIDCFIALQAQYDVERVRRFIIQWDTVGGLDFVHLCCLARCWAGIAYAHGQLDCPEKICSEILRQIEACRAADGGYDPSGRGEFGTAYGAFLALGAYQDLQAVLPEPMRLVQSLKFLETAEGAWANDRMVKVGSTNSTAAVVTVLRHLAMPVNSSVGHWLMAQVHPDGGFRAVPNAPIPDLLSTATALHALAGLTYDFSSARESVLDFVDTLWTNQGSFHGNWTDDVLDCEYTFYGLLALGHLATV
jgi:prenyltransferase beta subunit